MLFRGEFGDLEMLSFPWAQEESNISGALCKTSEMKPGAGGTLFRNLYRDFLKESYDLLKIGELKAGHEAFVEIAELWTSVSQLFEKVSQTKDFKYIQQASDILKIISDKEKRTMEMLEKIKPNR